MYEQLPQNTFPKTSYVLPSDDIEETIQRLKSDGFTFPFCVKPDVGMKGLLFRKIDNEEELRYYHKHVPVEYIVQDLVEAPLEVSVFYYRFPNKKAGVITGFIQKDLMTVVGDGEKTLLQLISEHPNAKHRLDEMKTKHASNLDKIVAEGQQYILTYAANLNRGARFTNLMHLADEKLTNIFDVISRKTSFYYGRFDLKCDSIEQLKEGKFLILEFNGSGAEPNHVYHSNYSWFKALSVFLFHWKILFQISMYNHKQGIEFWRFKEGWNFLQHAKHHFALLEKLDNEILV